MIIIGGFQYVSAYLNGTYLPQYFTIPIVVVKIVALGICFTFFCLLFTHVLYAICHVSCHCHVMLYSICEWVVLTIAGGLTLGLEGPFVYIGGGVAMTCLHIVRRFGGRWGRLLGTLSEERTFIAGGAAAGLAVAFSAPLAGVLLAIEAATAFVTTEVTIRIFACAMFAQLFSDLGHSNFSAEVTNHNVIFNAPDQYKTWLVMTSSLFFIISHAYHVRIVE
jgi:H+/Cl- antiporter ClcA